MIDIAESKITGTEVAYYIVCKRKLWLFAHHLEMEQFSDYVALGKLISEESFKRERIREIGDTIKIDFLKIKDKVIVHEVKKSRKLEPAHIWQVKYYIYQLQKKGVNCESGIIHYPKLMRKIDVILNKEAKAKIENVMSEIKETISLKNPPPVKKKPYCPKCAYYDYCFI